MTPQEIKSLADKQRERFALDQAFYRDPDIYRRDIEEIFLKSWLYAGHQSEIPNVGDWFLFEFDEESVINPSSYKPFINSSFTLVSALLYEYPGFIRLIPTFWALSTML